MFKAVKMAFGVFEWDYTVMHSNDNNNSSMTKINHVVQTPK
jgi:hypothetical protein